MATTPRSRQAARLRARRRRAQRRTRHVVFATVLGIAALATLLLTAFGSRSGTTVTASEAPVGLALPTGRPDATAVATVSNLSIQLPIAVDAVTAIGFHGSHTGGLELTPVGRQANEALLARLWHRITGGDRDGPTWYQLDGAPGTDVLDIGARAGTDVYAPVDGSIVALTPTIVNGRPHGSRIDIRPTAAPALIVSLTHIEPDPSLSVGSPVLAAISKLGVVVDIAAVEEQALADVTTDDGNNLSLEVAAAGSSLP